MVYGAEGARTGLVTVIECPAPDDGVELFDQRARRGLSMRLHDPSDRVQEDLDVATSGRDERLLAVPLDMLPEEVESLLDGCDERLLW
jgi:hypothetical protein